MEILKQEEILWYQKSREKWVRLGDRNTHFFHAQTVIKRKKSRINKLKRNDGTWSTDNGEMGHMARSYFQDLFGCNHVDNPSPFATSPLPKISMEGRLALTETVTKKEVHQALMSMKSYKAPGPDGFQPF